MKTYQKIILVLSCVGLTHCGSSSSNGGGPINQPDEVNLEKLIGTPFEGLTIGDEISWCKFQKGDFLTLKVPAFPIPVFLAFFTNSEEEIVEAAVQIANTAAGQEVFRVVDEWSDDVRVIYKVTTISDSEFSGDFNPDTAGITVPTYYNAENKNVSDVIVTDWQVEILDGSFDSSSDELIVAHELGHSFGIISHALIDYESDALLPLEPQSIMLNGNEEADYNLMMQKQAELYLDHVGEDAAAPILCP